MKIISISPMLPKMPDTWWVLNKCLLHTQINKQTNDQRTIMEKGMDGGVSKQKLIEGCKMERRELSPEASVSIIILSRTIM